MNFYSTLVLALILLATAERSHSLRRTLNFTFNEGCPELCKNKNISLGHVEATGTNDTIHYIWDFTKNPTILIAVTSSTAKLQIDWPKYISRNPNSLNFTEKPVYTFGVSIERILEFNDISDVARIDLAGDKNIAEIKFEYFQWNYIIKNFTDHDNYVEFFAEAQNYKDIEKNETRNGKVKFLVEGFSTLNHSHIIPCLLHSANASEVDIIIDNLETHRDFSHSRFALELLIVSESSPNSTLDIDTRRKLDDEFTPGIFEILNLQTPKVGDKEAYLQWRPVSYTHYDRDVTNSTGTVSYPLKNATVDNYFFKNNSLYMYYGENMFNNLVQRMNISFGQQKDGWYQETNYTTWTFNIGYGSPPDEQFSSVVIMIIAIGIGLPTLALTIAGIYVCVRRRNQRADELIEQ